MYPYQTELIDQLLEEKGLEHLKCKYLYTRSYEVIKEIINLPFWQMEKYQHLVTSKIFETNAQRIRTTLGYPFWEDERYAHLLTPSIWAASPDDIVIILAMSYWNDPKFAHLLTPSIWHASPSKIDELLALPYWNDDNFNHLLSPSMWKYSKKRFVDSIEAYLSLGFSPQMISPEALGKTKEEINAIADYLIKNGQDLIVNGTMNPFFVKRTIDIPIPKSTMTNEENTQAINDLLESKKLAKLKSPKVYALPYERVVATLDLPCWNDDKYKHLFTKGIWLRTPDEIERTLALTYWDDKKFAHLFTANIWKTSPEEITAILDLPYWNIPHLRRLLSPAILSISCQKLVSIIETYRRLKLDRYIKVSSLRKSREQIIVLYKYMIENRIPLIVDGEIHYFFSLAKDALFKNHGIDIDYLVELEREKRKKS